MTQLRELQAPGDVSPNDLSPIEDSPDAPRSDGSARGRRLSHYEIVSRIGSGGMGEVYRAKDLSLGRDVAVKVVQESVSSDPERLERFEREARAAAALNHPNIATVYQIGEHEGTRFIAMELVEGQTLGELLKQGPLPIHEVLRLGTQLAGGLAKAHAAGIVHRDLKPANVMVTNDGLAKILDFGLAKRMPHASDVDHQLTREGAIMGTLHYMSPEQAATLPVDHRSDQFSFGSILYEMATGTKAFEKGTLPETMTAIIREEPTPMASIDPSIPAEVSAIVKRCLEKNRDRRFESTAILESELARELALLSAVSLSVSPRPPKRRQPVALGLVVLAAAAAGALLWYASRPAAPEPPAVPLVMVPLTSYPGSEKEPTFSPDGSQVAFSWDGESQDNRDIYVKAVGAERPLRLTSDPAPEGSPAWAPDGRQIAFLRDTPGGGSEVRLIPPTGGPDRLLAELATSSEYGLAWSPDGRRLAVADRSSAEDVVGLFVVDAESGLKERLTLPSDARVSDHQPAFSPDGRTLAFKRSYPSSVRIHLVPAAGGEARELSPALFQGPMAWAPGGEEILFAAASFVPEGDPAGDPVLWRGGDFQGAPGLWRISADGGPARALAGTAGCEEVAVSRDGSRVACTQQTSDFDIWRLDLRLEGSTGEAQTRFIASTRFEANPQFSPDDGRVAFTSARSGNLEIWVADREGSDLLRLTSLGTTGFVGSPRWSPDGKSIAFDFAAQGEGSNWDVFVVSASGGPPRRVTEAASSDVRPSWSTDGHWIYFASDRSGEWQVWKVEATGETEGGARPVTRGGGVTAIESLDGRHVYFARRYSNEMDPENAIWRVPVEGGDEQVVVESLRSSFGQWGLTADGIYFVDEEPSSSGARWVVKLFSFDRRRVTEVAELRRPPAIFGLGFSVSSDGRSILSTHEQEESDLMLVEDFR
jgi:serine/threonine protein kinase